ncbi:MAG: hypothetical protein GXP25_08165 [Planctomycetes bacterium]|nr:hypothetical protein [Planctomycetota bacterium]
MKHASAEEAIAAAAIASGVKVAAGYPGSPSTDAMEAFARYAAGLPVHVEWSSNEKAALDVALGAAIGGARSMVFLKSVGMNVAADSLLSANMTGVDAGCVILLGDDPGAWKSQNEQDTRWLALFSELPLLEPITAEAAPGMVEVVFELSEKFHIPVFLRITRSLGESRVGLTAEPAWSERPLSEFKREHLKWIVMTANAVKYHERLAGHLARMKIEFCESALNPVHGNGATGIIACGFAYSKLMDVMGNADPPQFAVLGLATINPLPERRLIDFIQGRERVVVLEENEPIVETQVKALIGERHLAVQCHGKASGDLPHAGELFRAHIAPALQRLCPSFEPAGEFPTSAEEKETPTKGGFCEGCPHAATLAVLREAIEAAELPQQPILCGDPGCMVKGLWPPFQMLDIKLAMGCSIGLAKGVAHAREGHPVIALVGDSSFFHTGINNLINAAHNRAPITIVILHNSTIALTGQQSHPGSGTDIMGREAPTQEIENIARACGIEQVATIDPHEHESAKAALVDALRHASLSVVVSRAPCCKLGEGEASREVE